MLILNVDDDSDDREFFGDAIKAVDPAIPCVLFANGEALLYYLEKTKTPPDYIFIDINMPKMNGYECAHEIISNYPTGETQIVMYSTAFNPVDRAKFEEQGFKYIIKQNSLGALVKSIKGVMAYDLP
jgi:CheY-like chemotaxis protein